MKSRSKSMAATGTSEAGYTSESVLIINRETILAGNLNARIFIKKINQMKSRLKSLGNYTAFALTAVLLSCGNTDTTVQGNHEVAVNLYTVESKQMTQPVYASGLLFSETEAVLSFKIGGIIQEIFVEEGDAVKKGQLLARLDLTEINAQVIQAQNGVGKAERDLSRVTNLYADSVATLENLQDLTTVLNVTKEGLRIAEFNQKFAEIRAVSNGSIVKKMKNRGELVSPGMPIFFMNDTGDDQWKLQVGIADKDWVRLKEGDRASVLFDAYPETEFEGSVIRLATGADPTNGSYQVEIQVDPKGNKFAPGLYAETKIIPSQSETYKVIPVEALVEGSGTKGFVFTMNGKDSIKKIPIEVAFLLDNQLIIKSGLENIQHVISAGSGYLTEHSTVKVVDEGKNLNAGL
ncbi:efflux RND transporter periplasmic adaptor subunit [Algoriphagus sp. D3-2-R+10]|uniref:efflux RND transporter periplasmic adaptor subunit n=1 Tax=Algoriphagus aurantiacus TaxID=3103948 RepID=UPI002B371A6E|nr:efflux RND transporter periplasmic adaptor subunit [Algoriphagus sp. D3-2-R+10]MEB2778342.1 efflux RND transporter periplasmic adaptor subunit [Algoriphagus sp. D3-2-R+10]